MRAQNDVEVQIAVTPSVQSLAAFSRHAQPLTVGRAFRNARLEYPRDPSHQSLLVELRHAQVNVELGTVGGLVEGDRCRYFIILAGNRNGGAALRTLTTSGKPREKVRKIHFVHGKLRTAKLLCPIRRRTEVLAGLVGAELIVGSTLLRVLQCFVGLADFLETLLRVGFFGNVRMIPVREFTIRLLDFVGARVFSDAQYLVVILVFHGWDSLFNLIVAIGSFEHERTHKCPSELAVGAAAASCPAQAAPVGWAMAFLYYIYYSFEPGKAPACEARTRELLNSMKIATGVAGRLLKKRGEPNLWMEIYE